MHTNNKTMAGASTTNQAIPNKRSSKARKKPDASTLSALLGRGINEMLLKKREHRPKSSQIRIK